jgi:hypothetical protein
MRRRGRRASDIEEEEEDETDVDEEVEDKHEDEVQFPGSCTILR